MKNKKIFILLIFVLIIILISLFLIINNFNNNLNNSDENNLYSEYVPEEEISTTQMRETMVTLYFLDPNTNTLKNNGKLIDSISLLKNPYKKLVELLLEAPTDNTLNNVFPENTQILDATIVNGCVTLNFSNELLNINDENQKNNIINSLLYTLTQLNEVNTFKILINNEKNDEFNNEYSL